MDVLFSQLCTCGRSGYDCLQTHIDACAAVHKSYEFRRCRMFPGCVPAETAVGFWRGPDGAYLVYLRPAVSYEGEDSRRCVFFRRDAWRFPTFQAMERCLSSLGRGAAPQPPEEPMPETYLRLRDAFGAVIVGQEQAVEAVSYKLFGHISKQAPRRPLSLILYGPTGVGKSELGKAVAPVLNRCLGAAQYQSVWTELNTFTQQHSVYRLTGAPPGYVGYEDKPVFEAVRRNPCTVFMFDELEKAHPEVLKVFMSILDEGRITARHEDEAGTREMDFRRCIFVFTTNADLSGGGRPRLGFSAGDPPARRPAQAPGAGGPGELAGRLYRNDESARVMLVRTGVLGEIAGRFSGLIAFHPLDAAARAEVTAKQIVALGQEFGVRITGIAPALLEALTPREAFSPRSTAGILEGLLTPLLLRTRGRGTQSEFHLAGDPGSMRLLPANEGSGISATVWFS